MYYKEIKPIRFEYKYHKAFLLLTHAIYIYIYYNQQIIITTKSSITEIRPECHTVKNEPMIFVKISSILYKIISMS